MSSSDTTASFTMNLEDTTLTAPASQLLLSTGQGATLTSTLTDPQEGAPGDGGPIAGKPVTMQIGASGPLPASLQGPQTISDTFTSDGNYAGATASQPAIVFTYLAAGTFTLGDVSVNNATSTTVLTWWADTWNSLNVLSGGSAPAAFKGFASHLLNGGQPTTQLACGDAFTSTGGNSSGPPGTVPAYMAVAVSSKITKSGSVIAGNVKKVVIVQTLPGYQPMPVSFGTGNVVATICG
jgi:hypothetical protein